MKKNYLFGMWSVIASVILFGFNQQAVAQLTGITVSDDNETWYYIESGHSAKARITSSDGRFGGLISSNGSEEKADLDLLRSNDKRESQRWKVVAVPDETGFYYLINQDGEYFYKGSDSFYASTTDPGDAGQYNLVEVPDSRYYTIRRKGRTDGETKLEVRNQEAGFDFVESEDSVKVSSAEYGITGSPRSWHFVPVAEIDDIYPEIYSQETAVENIVSWYYLKSRGVAVSTVPYLALTETANVFRAKSSTDDEQLFGFISSERTTGAQGSPVYIVNKAHANRYVGTGTVPIVGWPAEYYPNGALLGDAPYKWYIGHVVKTVGRDTVQNTIRTGRNEDYLAPHSAAAKVAVIPALTSAFSGDDASNHVYGTNYTWIFEKAEEQGSSIKTVLSNDRLLKTAHYTLQGVLIPSPNRAGVYIVKKTYASGKTEASKIIYTK